MLFKLINALPPSSFTRRDGKAINFAAIRAPEAKRARKAAKRAAPAPEQRYECGGMDVVVWADNAPEMANMPLDSIGVSGSKFFVRESMWPALKVAIESQSPAFATP